MLNEYQLSSCQADQTRTDFAAIESDLEVVQARLATRVKLPLLWALATAGMTTLVSVGIEGLPR